MQKIISNILKFFQYASDNRFELIEEFTTDKTLRHRISLYLGGAMNFLAIIFYFISGIWYRSTWFFSISVFYFLLVLAKSYLANMEKQSRISSKKEADRIQLTGYLRCGFFLLLVNFAMTGIAMQVIYKNKHYQYAYFFVIGIGAIAFYNLINAIIQICKYAKTHNYIWSAVWSVNLAAALFGMYTLQTALFAQFDSTSSFAHTMNYITSINIFLILLFRSIYMIVHGKKMLYNQ